jgi:alkylhydroperoxidase domain protein
MTEDSAMTDAIVAHPDIKSPPVFTKDEIGWLPWLAPLAASDLTPKHWQALVEPARAKSDYFMLLVRDPGILEARTLTDKDIFYNPDGGLPRAERELAALAASRFNGCIFCASVHARFAATYSKRSEDVQRLLDEGVGADVGERWNAIVAASVALTKTPSEFSPHHVTRLRDAGLDKLAIADIIQSAAFFNWANRLTLSLGEPDAR